MREAMRELSFEGLVTIDSYRGGVVTAVTKPEVEEIVRIRQVLEPIAARESVVGMTPIILADAQAILDEMAASDSWDVWVQGNRAFHRKLYEASPSRRLVSLIKSLQDTQVVFVSATLQKSPMLKETATRDHHDDDRGDRSGRCRPSHRDHIAASDDPDQRLILLSAEK